MDIDYPDLTGIDSLDRWLEELVDGLRYPSFDAEALTVSGHAILNQGTIAGIEITESTLNISPGGDLNFVGTSHTTNFGIDDTGSNFNIDPSTAASVTFYLGNTTAFLAVHATATSNIMLAAETDADNHAALYVDRGRTGASEVYAALEDEGTTKTIRASYENGGSYYFSPDSNGDCDLGQSSTKWNDVHCTTINGAAPCRIKTGSYTGDGATSQGITGVGFQPKFVMVWEHPTAAGNSQSFMKLDQTWSTFCFMYSDTGGSDEIKDDRIISLDADGFTVDDNGSDDHPNANGTTYDYMALG